MLKCVVHAPPDCKQGLQKDVLQEEHDSIHHKLPSYHQRLIHTSISQPSGDIPKLTYPPNQVGIYQKFIDDKTRTLHHPSQA